jgi:hypothetical protein
VSAQPWFSAPNYPVNLGAVWDAHFGYLYKTNTAPLLLGEFGSKLATLSDQQWMDKLTDYVDGDFDLNGTNDLAAGKKGMSWMFWCFNPNSGDTGGIVGDDWTTVNQTKLGYIQASMAPMLGGGTGGVQTATFSVTLSSPAAQSVSVSWATVNGSAFAGVDFTAASGTLTFAPGETTKVLAIALLPNLAPTGIKTFTLQLNSPSAATLADATGVVTLVAESTPWQQWRLGTFTTAELGDAAVSGTTADGDADGLANFLEYLLGDDPKIPNTGPVVAANLGGLAITFSRSTAATDATLTVQGANSVVAPWTDLAISSGGGPTEPLVSGVSVSESATGEIRTVEVRDGTILGAPSHSRRFLRLQGSAQ